MMRRVRRLEAQGWLEADGEKDATERVVRLTEQGVLRALGGCNPEERWNRGWDGRWRMVVFDLPEEQRGLRNALRKHLQAARFGGLQGSVWISPDSLAGTVAVLRETAAACGVMTFFEGTTCGGESHHELVAAAWNFKTVNQSYTEYLGHLKALPAAGVGKLQENPDDWWQHEHALWQTCMAVDPLLPRELLPDTYAGETAWRERHNVLREAATLSMTGRPKPGAAAPGFGRCGQRECETIDGRSDKSRD